MKFSALSNFQFSIFNFQSKFNFKILNIENSFHPDRFGIKFQILLFLLLATCYLLLATPVSAQSQTNPYTVPNTTPDVPKNLHTWTQNVMIEVMSAMSCQLSGIDPTNPKHQCLGVDSKSGKIGYVAGGGGAIGMMGKMIGMLYTPPLHTSDYFRYLAHNFGIAKPAYASGFEGLKPIQGVWVAFRNIVYLLFVVIFVVIGLAIMLRVRIDPRTVMTIQNQIPKIIIGILLVTFSFAIAGFLIDLMYATIFLSYEVISGTVAPGLLKDLNPLSLQGKMAISAAGGIKTGGVFGIAHAIALDSGGIIRNFLNLSLVPFSGFKTIFDIYKAIFTAGSVSDAITNGLANYLVDFASIGVALRIGSTMTTLVSNPTFLGITIPIGTSAGITFGLIAFTVMEELLRFAIPYLIVFLIVLIALTFALFRLWFTLILAYVGILLDVVFAPFWIAGALLPGSSIGFGAWLRSIIANLAAFPATIIMFLLAKVFIDAFGASKSSTDFVPPLIGSVPGKDIIGDFIGLGILLMTPSVVAMVKAALKAPGVPAAGPIMAAIAVGGGVLTGPAGALKQGIGLAFGSAAAARFGLGGPPKRVGPAQTGSGGGAACLPGDSLISVPNGFALIKNLKSGDLVWSVDRLGRRVHAVIVKTTKRIVSKNHKAAHIVLKDGRRLVVSLGHPTIDYRQLGSLVKGEDLDMSFVASIKVLPYKGRYTYDILPDGDTGGYWADNILIGSTLSSKFQKTISDGFAYFKSIE